MNCITLALFNIDCKAFQLVDQVVGLYPIPDQFFINKKIGNLSDCQPTEPSIDFGDIP